MWNSCAEVNLIACIVFWGGVLLLRSGSIIGGHRARHRRSAKLSRLSITGVASMSAAA